MARKIAPAVRVITLLRGMTPEVRQTVLDMARDEFTAPARPKVGRPRKQAAPKEVA